MIVCHCSHVSERAITKAVRRGAETLGAVAERTGAARGCGCCVATLKRLIEEQLGASPTEEPSHEAA